MTVRPRLQHAQIVKAVRLMDMLYTPSELAEELDITADTIVRTWIPAGLPFDSDGRGHKWINGKLCAEWINALRIDRSSKRSKSLAADQAFCLNCKKAVALINPVIKPVNRFIELLQAPCPKCGKTVNRARGRKKHSGKGIKNDL